MRKSPLNAPKRVSQPPSLSREDAQMSANDFRLRDGIRFHPIPCGGSGEERFCTSGSAEDFARLSAVFLGRAPRGPWAMA